MKVLTIGDCHIKVNNIKETDDMIEKLVALSLKIKPDFIVCLGDILDRHATIHVIPLMRAEKLILSLSQIAPTFLLVGNHDRPNNSNYLTDEHPFNAMKFWKNTYIIDKVESHVFNGFRFVFAPYVAPGRFSAALSTIADPYKDTVAFFAHQEIRNCKLGGIISECGDIWDLSDPLLISGHIHDYDLLQPNMIYVGVPFQHLYSDSFKTVSVFTFTKERKEGEEEEKINWSQERIDLGIMKKAIVHITADKVNSYEPPEDKMIKLIISGDEAEIKAVAKLAKIQELKKKGVKVAFKSNQVMETSSATFVPKMPYKERLLSEIDSDCIKWFHKIFAI
jgi:DNA repair exonuclease SbcCD nuclease subunit